MTCFLLILSYLLFLLLYTQKKWLDYTCLSFNTYFYDLKKKKPLEKQLRGERCLFGLACDSKWQSTTVGKVRQREPEAAGHFTSTVKKREQWIGELMHAG